MVGSCVILAAGEGSRLRGTVARGLKPLVLIEGEPLVVRIARQATLICCEVIVVVSPTNAGPVTDVMEARGVKATYVLQPSARGPGDALRIGLSVAQSEYSLVLVGDNVVSDEDVERVWEARPAVGVRRFAPTDQYLARLTRKRDGRWVEKVPLSPNETGIAWTGPFAVETKRALKALEWARRNDFGKEILIGPYFNGFFEAQSPPREVEVWSVDVGDGSWKL